MSLPFVRLRFPKFRYKAVTLSYDDGVRQDKKLISIMKKNGLKGTFNLNGGLFDEAYNPNATEGRMSAQEAVELYLPSGMEIAVHGYKHLLLARLDAAVAADDVLSDRKKLESLFGTVIGGMAYAFGSYDDKTVEILKSCGIEYARTGIATERFDLPSDWLRLPPTCHHDHPRLMDLAKQFIEKEEQPSERNKTGLFYLWGHSCEFDDNDNWNVIETFAEYVGGRDNVWYATNGEIFRYLQAGGRVKFSVDGKYIYNPSAMDVYFDIFGRQCVVPAGQVVSIEQ